MGGNIPRPELLSADGLNQEPHVKRRRQSISSAEILCSACSAVQWSFLASNQPDWHAENMVMKVPATHDELQGSTCRVCRALALIKPAELDGQDCSLRVYGSQRALTFWNTTLPSGPWNQCTLLGIVSPITSNRNFRSLGFLALLGQEPANFDFGPRRILPGSIDYSHLESVMCLCLENHPECRVLREPALVDRLRVIDCVTRNVVQAPEDCQYLALSYVWGSQKNAAAIIGDFPPVVEDSIKVTIELGFRYLWVDRHCISQDEADKHHMIGQMGRIYSNAFLTIIAAAGADAQYGLPGVGECHRVEQLEIKVDDYKLIQIFPMGSSSIKGTKWASRGWTYQEGYLSRRRLIFTDQQVIYLCTGLFAPESVAQPLRTDMLDADGNPPFLDLIPHASTFTGSNSYTPDYRPRFLLNQISEYTRRELSYETDSLDAFKGVLASYETNKKIPINHLWGIPVQGESKSSLSLLWYHKNVATRRPGFPSWSWAGWAGEVSWVSIGGVVIGDSDRCRITLSSPINTAPRQLQITSLVVKLRIAKFSLSQEQLATRTNVRIESYYEEHRRRVDGIMAVFRISSHALVAAPIFFDSQVETKGRLIGLVFALGNHVGEGHIILVLREHKHSYERTGFVAVIHTADSDSPMLYLNNEGQILDDIWIKERDHWAKHAKEITLSLD
ncbi:heterokaryon incompatibility protein-domain-containing protein [Hypoxylon rubiginosum]|uniref:Heterokaryon incompatibility protein-domain-containing protein n=1 Tax=Hypoxylon rubiginosum TaxID=110542 RepID=A0ACC0CV06_9PEZI|nr:heterokaryon incompatibility protein-domain-containing protein [Hypoxylon rubiginosum]